MNGTFPGADAAWDALSTIPMPRPCRLPPLPSLLQFTAHVGDEGPGSGLVRGGKPRVGESEREVVFSRPDVAVLLRSRLLVLLEDLGVGGHVVGEELHERGPAGQGDLLLPDGGSRGVQG